MEFIFGMILGGLFGLLIGWTSEKSFFEYLTFKKQQEFEKEKYYSEYAERYKGSKR